jgi:tRNA threonylcarbamoyladenosine biosynthesis protein TsaB
MALILNIETATRNCSVALSNDGVVTSLAEIAGEGYLHAEKLHIFIEEVVQNAGFTLKDLNAVAVSMGPGSYTGLRIGVSAAKGLCYALGLPLMAIDTLEVIARQIAVNENEFIVPLIDARRMEVYSAIYTAEYNKVREIKAEIITAESFGDFEGKLHMIGDGAAKCVEFLNSDRFIYHQDVLFPSSAQMCEMSFDKYKKSDTVDVAYFEPFYLKDFIVNK